MCRSVIIEPLADWELGDSTIFNGHPTTWHVICPREVAGERGNRGAAWRVPPHLMRDRFMLGVIKPTARRRNGLGHKKGGSAVVERPPGTARVGRPQGHAGVCRREVSYFMTSLLQSLAACRSTGCCITRQRVVSPGSAPETRTIMDWTNAEHTDVSGREAGTTPGAAMGSEFGKAIRRTNLPTCVGLVGWL